MPPAQIKQVRDYYDQTLGLYKKAWHRGKSYAMHYGFWDSDTNNLQDALINENKFLAKAAKITEGQKVLDAGCGIGGSAIWLAENIGANVVGITISKRQLAEAQRLAKEKNLEDKLDFQEMDYLKTSFSDGEFDVVWATESACHATDKRDFLREAMRVLKPGGKLIIADGILRRDVKDAEQKSYQDFLDGFALDNIAKSADLEKWMKELGFKKVKVWDKTEAVWPSSKILFRRTMATYPLAKLFNRLGVVSDVLLMNNRAGIGQYKIVKSGAAGYGVFYGEK